MPGSQSRMLFIQLRTPVRISSGLGPSHGLLKCEQFRTDNCVPSYDHDGVSYGGSIANGLTYSDDLRFPEDGFLHHGPDAMSSSISLPTYDEAVRCKNHGLRNEYDPVGSIR